MGADVKTLALPDGTSLLEKKSHESVRQVFAELPDRSTLIIDGLAFGVLDEIAEKEKDRLSLVAVCHHPLAFENGLDAQQQRALLASERRALACTKAIIVTSEHTRRILVGQFAVADEKITTALPGSDPVSFAACDGDPIRLLTVASLIPRKGHDVLIHALAQLSQLDWEACIIGSSKFEKNWASSLKQQVSNLNLTQRITFVESVENIWQEYQQADVFVLPSLYEGYGMVFAEALAAGLPVVGAEAGAVPDVVPENAGILVPPGDSDSLAVALKRLLTNKPLRKKLQFGAQCASANLPSWKESAQTICNTLKLVANS